MTSIQEPAGGTHPPVPPAPDPAHAFAPNGDGAGSGQAGPPPAARNAGASPKSPVQEASRPQSSPLTPLREGCGDGGAREGEAGILRTAGSPPALDAPRAARPHAAARGGKPKPRQAVSRTRRAPRARRSPMEPSEAQFQKSVTDLADTLGIWWYHAYQPQRDKAGLPDLIFVGSRKTVFRELKKTGEEPTAEQLDVGGRLTRSGEDWAVWWPADMQSGKIPRELQAIR